MSLSLKRSAALFATVAIPTLFLVPVAHAAAPPTADAQAAVLQQYARLPVAFEANRGQSDAAVRFQARGVGYGFYLTDREAVLNLDGMKDGQAIRSSVRTRLVGAAEQPAVVGERPLPGRTHILTGADAANWKTGIEQFGQVRYEGVYPGVDVVYYGTQSKVEFDYIVAPGADPSAIVMEIDGARSIALNAAGDLVVATETGDLVQHKPVIYQDIDGQRVPVEGRYAVEGQRVAFEVAEYDRSRTLVIDPLLAFNLYVPGLHREVANAIAVGGDGSAYIAGYSTPYRYANNLPLINGPLNLLSNDVFINKINSTGTAIEYATYLGGAADDVANAIAVDATGAAYVIGDTFSNDFPVLNAHQPQRAGFRDGFALKLSPDGKTLAYSTYLGGVADDTLTAVTLGADNSVIIAGVSSSLDYPVRLPIQATNAGRADGVVTRLLFNGKMAYSTYVGGSRDDGLTGIAGDTDGSVVVTGFSDSFDLPSTPGAFQPARMPNVITPDNPNTGFNEFRDDSFADVFVARVNAAGSALDYLTYLGGQRTDTATGVALDSLGNAYIAGYTESANFPLVNPADATLTGSRDLFVSKLNSNGTGLVYSTYFGGESLNEFSTAIKVDGAGRAWVTGYTSSISMPTLNPLQRANSGGRDALVFALNPAGNALAYSSYLGAPFDDYANGLALDADGNVYLTGYTFSPNFTTTRAPIQGASAGAGDPFVTKIAASGAALSYSTYVGETNVFLGLALGERNTSRRGPTVSLPLPLRGIIGCTLRAIDGGILAGTELLFPTRVVCGGDQAPPG